VIKLLPHVRDPFGAVNQMLGELLRIIGQDRSRNEVAGALLEIIVRARIAPEQRPAGELRSIADFDVRGGGTGILLGQLPNVRHLAGGYFMPRPDRAQEAADGVIEAMERDIVGSDAPKLSICWLSGPSGAGKSVLLLQTMEILAARDDLAVHDVTASTTAFERALEHWRTTEGRVVMAIDDLFAPARRSSEQWDRIIAVALDPARSSSMVVLTTGPDDYRNAFQKFAKGCEAFRVVPIRVTNLYAAEREDYRTWFHRRTGVQPKAADEAVFVVAAFEAEIGRQSPTADVSEFAHRFLQRAADKHLEDALLAALSVNGIGIPAVETLFGDGLDDLGKLIDEEIVQREVLDGTPVVTVFHQRLAAALYAQLG
jgi:hypothetical protein